jgi:hypothetical protein
MPPREIRMTPTMFTSRSRLVLSENINQSRVKSRDVVYDVVV